MSSEIKPTRLSKKVPSTGSNELLYALVPGKDIYRSEWDGKEFRFNRKRMQEGVGTIFDHTCLEAFGTVTYPTFACPNRWGCDHCSIAATVAKSRDKIAKNKPQLP